MMEAFASMGARIVQHSVPARGEATRSCQLRRPGHAHWRGTGAQMRKGGNASSGPLGQQGGGAHAAHRPDQHDREHQLQPCPAACHEMQAPQRQAPRVGRSRCSGGL
jgi:hypothetical protein